MKCAIIFASTAIKQQNRLICILHSFELMDVKRDRGILKKIIVSLANPVSIWLHKFAFFQRSEYKLIKKLMAVKQFAFILSTCESFASHLNVLKLKKETDFNTPWIAYNMDPFAYYIGNLGSYRKLVQLECEVYEKSDLVLVTEEIYHENNTNAFKPYLYKTKPIRFGNFRLVHNDLIRPIFVEGKINCVYVGSLLNEIIRSPEYLYHLINKLDDRYMFYMICNNFTGKNKQLRDKELKCNDRVRWYYDLPLQECFGIMCHADILINLGNKSVNQTPSKIFDYIGTGRPIVNLYSLENDTSKRYLERYPDKINLFEDEKQLDENTGLFEKFAENCHDRAVPKEALTSFYYGYLSEIVTQDTIKIIEDSIHLRL